MDEASYCNVSNDVDPDRINLDLDLDLDLIDKCQITLSRQIKEDTELLKQLTFIGFKIVDFGPIVIECDSFPAENKVSKLYDVLSTRYNIQQKNTFDNLTLSVEKGDLSSRQCYDNEAPTGSPTPDTHLEPDSDESESLEDENGANHSSLHAKVENQASAMLNPLSVIRKENKENTATEESKTKLAKTKKLNPRASENCDPNDSKTAKLKSPESNTLYQYDGKEKTDSIYFNQPAKFASEKCVQKQIENAMEDEDLLGTQEDEMISYGWDFEKVSSADVYIPRNKTPPEDSISKTSSLGDDSDDDDKEELLRTSNQENKKLLQGTSDKKADKTNFIATDDTGFKNSETNSSEDADPKNEVESMSSQQSHRVQDEKNSDNDTGTDEEETTLFPIKKDIFDAVEHYYKDTPYMSLLNITEDTDTSYELKIVSNNDDAKDFLLKIKDFKKVEVDIEENIEKVLSYLQNNYPNIKTWQKSKTLLVIMGPSAEVRAAQKTILSSIENKDHEAFSSRTIDEDHFSKEHMKETGQIKDSIDAHHAKHRNTSTLNATNHPEKAEVILNVNSQQGREGLKDRSIKQPEKLYDDQHKQQATKQAYKGTSPDEKREQRQSDESNAHEAVYVGSSGIKVYVYAANITEIQVDCIVNAANSHLKHRIGVSGAIAKAAGPALVQECEQFIKNGNFVAVTDIFVSGGGDLYAKKVIHAVGPCWDDYDSDQKQKCLEDLKKVVLRCLVEASWMKMTSIALPSISSAIYKVPKQECAESYMNAVKSFDALVKKMNLSSLQDIHFVDINNEMVSTVAGCVLENKNQVLTSEALIEDLAFVQKHLDRSRELNIGKEASIFPSNYYNNYNIGFSRKVVEHKDYYFGKTKLRISTQHAMDFNTDLIITVGEPFDKLSGKSSFRTRKSKINSESQEFEFFTYVYEDKPPRFLCVLGVNFARDDEIVAALKNLNSAISCYPNLVQSLVVTSKFLYPEKILFSSKQPDSNLVTIISQLVYDYVKNAPRDAVMKTVLISTSDEAFSSIIQVIDTLESSGQAGLGGSSVDDICSHCKRSVRDLELLQCCKKIYCLECRAEHKNCSLSHKAFFRIYTGNQPDGDMIVTERSDLPIPGYTTCGVFLIEYVFPNGVQNQLHPDPGKPYFGCYVVAYLPTTQEGYNVLQLLRVAFLRRLTFTIGFYGRDYHVKWSGINLYLYDNKTDLIDSNYLPNVTAELRSKGVTMDNLTQEELADLERLRQYLHSKKRI
ncbi:uncharacterized protein LOC131943424 [Physella acuta]|uniref:uncharacterized protein LOC131943424 n=1 Tax=Physella acuta TaxID=109671 RepID=UPI0027DDBD52|nr:uncharacterized protein LOC131943424 [Physella acuta]